LKSFEYFKPKTLEDASRILLSEQSSEVISGSTDLLGEMKEGVAEPSILISLSDIPNLRRIIWDGDGLTIGAMVTLADIVSHPEIRLRCLALAEAAESVATPQIRNIGTLGGNLCQRPRCWYYRSSRFDCAKKGGDICFAVGGLNKYHAVIGGAGCYIVHPSDTATALVALGASAKIFGAGSERTVPIADFFAGPDVDVTRENILRTGELLISVNIPLGRLDHPSSYLKAKERQSMDFALTSAAVLLKVSDGVIFEAGVSLGGVAPVPWHLISVETALKGIPINSIKPEIITSSLWKEAEPMSDNGYKIQLSQTYLNRAIMKAVSRA
jgi:xanthine dehydrogenase YagS FAD-binding subunit|tara:strand:- start:6730 stop:7710 length:981 start_codon:yes stop_codon:yes gene_type:complete